MENEIIETVLTELLEEQKQGNVLANKNTQFLAEQMQLFKNLEEKLANQNEEVKELIITKIEKIATELEIQAKPVKREFRILLFPEQDTSNYYKIVFGRIFFWLVMLCIAKYAYLLGNKWISTEYENHKYQKAWETLYKHQSKENQKIMRKIWDEQ